MAMRSGPVGGTATAATVADVLTLFTDAGRNGLGVTEISRRLGLSKAVVHRILQSLRHRELVTFDEQRRLYKVGTALVALGAAAFRDLDLRTAALPVLHRLAEQSQETATVSALVGAKRVYVDQVVSPQELKLTVEIGRPFPLHVGASGRAMLACAPRDLQEHVLGGTLEPLTDATITDPAELRAMLAEIASDRVSVSRAERSSVSAAVAAPVFRLSGDLVGAVAALGPRERMTDEVMAELIPIVRAAATDVSNAMS